MINFTYDDNAGAFDHMLKTKTADGLVIQIFFEGFDAVVFNIGQTEFDVKSDEYNGLYVSFGGVFDPKIVPLATVIQQANAQIEDIVDEIETESRNWDRHCKSFSQPSL